MQAMTRLPTSDSKKKAKSRTPKYVQLEQELRQYILSLPEGQKIPPVRELMRHHRISMATVTRALRSLEQEGLISAHIGRGTFTSRPQPFHQQQTGQLIGIIVPMLDDQFFGRVVRAIERRCAADNYNILVRHLDGHKERIHFHFQQLKQAGISGLIYAPAGGEDMADFNSYNLEFLEHFLPSRTAGVILDQEIAGTHFPCVRCDHMSGAQLLANHLYLLGHRNIVMVDSYKMPATEMRWQAFSAYLEARGCKVTRLAQPGVGHNPQIVRAVVKKLRSMPEVTAIFAVNDRIALNILFECQRQGVNVPGQLSIVGFDDLEIGRWCEPPLTSIAQPLEDIGRRAAEVLLDQILKSSPVLPQSVVLPVSLIERSSSAAVGGVPA